MNNPYIVSMLTTQYTLEEQIEVLDKILMSDLSTEIRNHLILARAGLTHDLLFLTKMIEKAHQEIDRGTLEDPSFNALLKEVDGQ